MAWMLTISRLKWKTYWMICDILWPLNIFEYLWRGPCQDVGDPTADRGTMPPVQEDFRQLLLVATRNTCAIASGGFAGPQGRLWPRYQLDAMPLNTREKQNSAYGYIFIFIMRERDVNIYIYTIWILLSIARSAKRSYSNWWSQSFLRPMYCRPQRECRSRTRSWSNWPRTCQTYAEAMLKLCM